LIDNLTQMIDWIDQTNSI